MRVGSASSLIGMLVFASVLGFFSKSRLNYFYCAHYCSLLKLTSQGLDLAGIYSKLSEVSAKIPCYVTCSPNYNRYYLELVFRIQSLKC